ncbi:MAG TPA: hypothetical protein VFQ58_07890 [Flavisolibacter sp.]|nr:hypothetical protein [Flavisolibacter sp.]
MAKTVKNLNIVHTTNGLKRLAAILFTSVVLFNLYGYQLFIDFFQNKQESQLQASLDNEEYNDQDLVYIKLPVNLPYYSNTTNYEKINGTVTVKGVEYKYVKRRVFNDSIELACIINTDKQQFQSARNEFMKLGSDWLNTHTSKKSTTNIKVVTLDFCNKINSFSIESISYLHNNYSKLNSIIPKWNYPDTQEQPPDAILG